MTSRVELVTAVIILPQRQTALVAKQAAAVDVLSRGRLRLGIGVGWNPVEYEALGKDFHGPWAAVRRTDRPDAETMDQRTRQLRRQVAQGHRRRPQPPSGAAAYSNMVRRGRPPDHQKSSDNRRWLVPTLPPDDHGRELIASMREQAQLQAAIPVR